MDFNRCKSLNELLLKPDFQNTVQGVHALNSARNSFCDLIEKQWRHFIATLPTAEKEQLGTFIRCVNQHGMNLVFANINLGCGHENCELLYIRLKSLDYVTGDISAEQNRGSLLQEQHHSFSNTDNCFTFIWDLAHCFIGVKTQDVKLHGREMNAKTLIKLMKNCKMFAFKDSEKIYGQVLEDIDRLIYAKNLLISKEDRDMLFDHLLVLLGRWKNNCKSCSYGLEDIKKIQQDNADCEIFEYQFLVKNVLEIIKNMLDDRESEFDLPANIKSKDVSSSKKLITSLLLQMEEMISVQEAYEQSDSLEEDPKTLKTETDIEISKEEAKMSKTREIEDKMKQLEADNKRHQKCLAQVMNDVSETKEENKQLKENYLKLQMEIYQMRFLKDEEIRKYKELQLKLKTLETDPERQPSQKETMTPKSGHPQQNSDAPVVKASSPCKETENADRLLRSPEQPYGNDEQTSNALRTVLSPESAKSTGEETATNNESRFNRIDEELRTKVKAISSRKGRGWSPHELDVFKHPMCLISAKSETNEDGEEIINLKSKQEVLEQIKKIDLPMVVVAVVGLYRTGKSYLMNLLAQQFKGGFAVGNTLEPKTEGIWVWCRMHPKQKDTVLVLLDTEGLGNVEKGNQSYDINIFTLATLLCNCLVYNIKGVLDNEAMSKLTFVTEMANNIRYRGKTSEDNPMLNLILPNFVLCLRDFTLELEKDGKVISANEYLETSLASKKGKASKFNKPRECIRKYFPKRECFAFPMPGDTSVIRNLENLSFADLCNNFKDAIRIFVSYIYDIPPKEIARNKPINGEMFVTLADRYVTAINFGAVLDVDDAFEAAAAIENAKIKTLALEIFENHIGKLELPVSVNVLRLHYIKAQHAALEYLRQNAVLDFKDDCENQAQRKMDELLVKIKEENDKRVQELCKKTLQDNSLIKYIKEKIKNELYETAGGYQEFQLDVKRLKGYYFKVLNDFDENEILKTWVSSFLNTIEETEARILEADMNLSKKEKEDEERRNRENIQKIWKTKHEALDKQKKDIDDHYKKLGEDREKQMKAEQAKYEAFLNIKFDKERAQKELLEKEKRERKDKWFAARMWKAFWYDD